LIVKQSIDAVRGKFSLVLRREPEQFRKMDFPSLPSDLIRERMPVFRKDHAPKELDHDPIQFDRIMIWSLR